MRSINTRPLTSIVNKQKIEPGDLKRLRRVVFPRGLFSVHAADTLAHIQEICESTVPDWPEYYLTAMVKFILQESNPKGCVTLEQTQYLFQRLSDNGIIGSSLNYELLLRILDQATDCPDELVLFALDQIRLGLTGESELLRKDVSPLDRALRKSDVDLIKRILFPAAPASRRRPTRAQVEFLMDLNELTEQYDNHRSWTDLYTKTISGFLLNSSKAKSRDHQHRATWLRRHGLSAGLHLLRPSKAHIPPLSEREQSEPEAGAPSGQRKNGNFAKDDPITWFIGRLKDKKRLNSNDTALLAKLKAQSSRLHAELSAFLADCDNAPRKANK